MPDPIDGDNGHTIDAETSRVGASSPSRADAHSAKRWKEKKVAREDPAEQIDYSAEGLIARKKRTWPETGMPVADLVVRLFRLRDLIHESSRARAKKAFNLTPAEFEVLVTLRTMAPPHQLTPTKLRKSMLITPGGLTKVIRNLESRGLVVRSQSRSDRRSWLTKLTPAGRKLAESALPLVLNDYEEQISKGLDASQMKQLSELLKRALHGLEPRRPTTGKDA